MRWFFGKSKKSKSHSEINRPLIRGDTSIFNHQSQKKSNHWKSISLFTSTEVVFTSIFSQVWKYSFINTWQQEKIKRSLLDDCMLVLSAKTVYSSTNLGSGKINWKMLLPFELLYLLDFFVKPLKKISDTCCNGRVVEFKKNEWKNKFVLWILIIFE